MEPGGAEARGSDYLKVAWQTGSLSCIPMLMLHIAGLLIFAPYLPDLMTNFFAEQESGVPIHCQDYSVHSSGSKLPQACIQGSAATVMWSSYSSFFSNAVLAFMFGPITGVWSDMIGRKPFLLLGQVLALLPKAIVLFHLTSGISLYLYYPIAMLGDVVSTISITLAMVSDCLPPEHRAAGFAITLGSLSMALAFAPMGGQLLGLTNAAVAAVALNVAALLYTTVVLRESVIAEIQTLAREKSVQFWQETQHPVPSDSCEGSVFIRSWHAVSRFVGNLPAIRIMVQGFSIVLSNSEFMRLTAAQMFASAITVGLMQVENQYLLVMFGFQQREFALVFLIAGVGMFVAQVLLLPLLLSVLREHALIVIGFAAVVLKLAVLAAATAPWQVFLSILLGTLYFMAYPSISSVKANSVPEHQQGAIQGTLSGATALASGLGPLAFNQLYSWATTSVFMPRLVPAVCAVLALVPLALVCALDLDKLKRWMLQQQVLQGSCSVEEPLLEESHEAVQHKLGESVFTAAQKDDTRWEGSELHRAGSSSRGGTSPPGCE